MLTPTHVQVAVLRTRDLLSKGKNGTNDVYVIYALGKEKYQSSVQKMASDPLLVWNEGCDLAIPSKDGNKAELILKVMHKASMGDKFLGRISLPLSEFDVTAKAKPVWYLLKPKVGSEKDTKPRGEIEVRISFLIKSTPENASTSDLSKVKRTGSFKSSIGSILSLGKGKNKKKKERKDSQSSKDSLGGVSMDSLRNIATRSNSITSSGLNSNLPMINDDPGVISEEEEDDVPLQFKIDRKQSGQGSISSVSESAPPTPKSTTTAKPQLQTIFNSSPPPDTKQKKKDSPPSSRQKLIVSESEGTDSNQLSPKPRTMRLPSVIVEEEPSSILNIPTSSTPDLTNSDISSQVTEGSATLPRFKSPPKIAVSASMSNLALGENNGKGSVRKSIKSMFSSSKHLSVDEIFPPVNNSDGSSGSKKKNGSDSLQPQPQFPGGFLMKRKDSLRDLGVPKETFKQYEKKSKEELVAIIVGLQQTVTTQKQKIGDLEDYIDKLLLRVIDNMPDILKKGNSTRARVQSHFE